MPPDLIKKTLTCSCCGRKEEMEGIEANLKAFDKVGWVCLVCNELPGHPEKMYPAFTRREAWVWALKHDALMTHQQIGQFLGIAIKTSETYLFRAKKRLKDMEVTLKYARD